MRLHTGFLAAHVVQRLQDGFPTIVRLLTRIAHPRRSSFATNLSLPEELSIQPPAGRGVWKDHRKPHLPPCLRNIQFSESVLRKIVGVRQPTGSSRFSAESASLHRTPAFSSPCARSLLQPKKISSQRQHVAHSSLLYDNISRMRRACDPDLANEVTTQKRDMATCRRNLDPLSLR